MYKIAILCYKNYYLFITYLKKKFKILVLLDLSKLISYYNVINKKKF